MTFYIETSALAKLVLSETETPDLLAWLIGQDQPLATSSITGVELLRAVNRRAPHRAQQVPHVLKTVTVTRLNSQVLSEAGKVKPHSLRSLDAIHIAAALDLRSDLDGMVTYDTRLAEAAALNGITVFAPGLV